MQMSMLVLVLLGFGDGAPWGYEGEKGPEHWGHLNPEYILCAEGHNQSPIDLSAFIEADLPQIEMNYTSDAVAVVNNGHTLQVNFGPGSSLTFMGQTFALKQFHVHAPSENTLAGKHFPMEVHLVHADEQGQLAVIGVFLEPGEANPVLSAAWQNLPKAAGENVALSPGITASGLIPADADYFYFNGSLTTPPAQKVSVGWS